MNDLLKKITIIYNVNGFFPLMLRTWAVVFLVKYINENVTMDKLSIAKIVIGTMTIIMLQYAKRDSVLDFISLNINKVYILYTLINILVVSVVLINPFIYIIVEAIQLGLIETIIGTALDDILNNIFKGRKRTNFKATWGQTKMFSIILGGILGVIFSDITLNIAVFIIIISNLIIIPGNWYMFNLINKARSK